MLATARPKPATTRLGTDHTAGMSIDEPRYDDLPIAPGLPAGSSWGVWGDDDGLGCLNRLRPERVAAAAAGVRTGELFTVGLDLAEPDPPLFGGRSPLAHTVIGPSGGLGHDDVIDGWNTQTSTQWDGFRHIRNVAHGYYNGLPGERLGIDRWARRGLAGRAVLADVARWRNAQGRPLHPGSGEAVEVAEVAAALEVASVEVRPGDLLLVRTGWLTWWRSLAHDDQVEAAKDVRACGLAAEEETARWLWDQGFAAVAADNPALEAWPPPDLAGARRREVVADPAGAAGAFLHTSLLALLGMPIGELWDLDAFAAHCAEDNRADAFFTSSPLALAGGVASPPNVVLVC